MCCTRTSTRGLITVECASYLRSQSGQDFAVDAVLVAIVRLGLQKTLDIQRANRDAVHDERADVLLQAFVGLAIGGKQDVDQQVVGKWAKGRNNSGGILASRKAKGIRKVGPIGF